MASTRKKLEMIGILGIVLVISGIANGNDGSQLKYDRRGLGGQVPAAPSGPHATLPTRVFLPPGIKESAGGDIDISRAPGAKGDGASDMTTVSIRYID